MLICSQRWWHTPIIPAHRRRRQEDDEFEASPSKKTLSQK
jgi:hypothetical protein